MAVLSDEQAEWKPTEYGYQLLGCEIRFKFAVVKLLDYQQRWEEEPMPYISSIERYGMEKVALQMLRRLLQHRFESISADVETALQEFTVEQLEKLFDAALKVESLDAFQERIDQAQGSQYGALRMLRRLLQRRFESVPEAVQTRLSQCSVQQLEALVDVALAVDSLDEFVNHLPVSDSTS